MGRQAAPFSSWTEQFEFSRLYGEMPSIIEWVTDERFLNRPNLYPRQATFLKIATLQDHLLTQYDFDVIGEWSEVFTLQQANEDMTTVHWQGEWGIQPDIFVRIKMLQERGYHWFNTILPILGRRSSKGYMGGLLCSYVLAHYLAKPDVRDYYGVDRSKRLAAQVFAGKKNQARDNQWRDIVNVITDAPIFDGFIGESLTDSLTVHSYHDRVQAAIKTPKATTMDMSTFEIVPKEATTMAGRGPASFMQCLDPSTRVLTADLRWVEIGKLSEGDELVGFDEEPPSKSERRKLRRSKVLWTWRTAKDALKLTFDDGSSIVCSGDHRWLTQSKGRAGVLTWRRAVTLAAGDHIRHLTSPWDEDRSWEAGYLAGIYDGEGCLSGWSQRAGKDVLVSQKRGSTHDRILDILHALGYSPKLYGIATETGVQQWALDGMIETMRFLGVIRPPRLMDRSHLVWEGVAPRGGSLRKTIASIEHLPAQELVDITTTTRTFIAEGLFSHNCYDEMAHMVSLTGGSRSAEEVWEAATPALDQFKQDQFRYCGSSPWQMTGKFYELAQQALEVDVDTGLPTYPDYLLLQLASWDMYKDWELTKTGFYHQRAHIVLVNHPIIDKETGQETGEFEQIPTEHSAVLAKPLKNAIQEYDEQMRRAERANPETFAVERRSRWAAVMDQYLPTEHVKRMFRQPAFLEEPLQQQRTGSTAINYESHCDPGKTLSNFATAIGHKVVIPGEKFPHVIIDFVHHWEPSDFPNSYSPPSADDNTMDYIAIEEELKELYDGFMPVDVSMDQWNCLSGSTMIQTERGMVAISDLIGDVPPGTTVDLDINVPTKDGWGTVKRGFHKGVIPTLRFRTKLGNIIEVSPEHRLWVERDGVGQWMEARYITMGDRLVARRNTVRTGHHDLIDAPPFDSRSKSSAPAVLTPDLAWLMGFTVAEGWVGTDAWSITQKSKSSLERVRSICEREFGGVWASTYDESYQGRYQVGRVQGWGSTARFFNWAGCGGRAQDKSVPWLIWGAQRTAVEGFLAGIFDGDGGVTLTESKGEWVHFESTSIRLAEEVQQLLWSVGVFCSLWRGVYRYKGEARERARITIYGDDLLEFRDHVGFSDPDKIAKLELAAERVRSRTSYRRRSQNLVGDAYAVRIVEITESEADCFDLEVPGDESFIANGIVSHNSIGMLQRLNAHLSAHSLKRCAFWERDATAILNWRTAETFKIALSLNLVHVPVYDQLELECTFLQKLKGDKVDHPDTGPCTTKDVYDAVSIVVYKLIAAEIAGAYGEMFSKLGVVGVAPGASVSGASSDGSTPTSSMSNTRPVSEVGRQFKEFTSGTRRRQSNNPARRRRT